jgi:hypothetical protein
LCRGLCHPPVADGEREPDQVRHPLVCQGHLPIAPRNDRGQHLHGPRCIAVLLQRKRVRGDQEVPVLQVGGILDGPGQAPAKVLPRRRALVLAPGDERGNPVY